MGTRKFPYLMGAMISCLVAAQALYPQQTRDEKVRGDRQWLLQDENWHYDDLDAGLQAARESGKPLMVVLRCIP